MPEEAAVPAAVERRRPRAPAHLLRGMALIAVLWIVAAISILVIGVTASVRQHIEQVGLERDQVTGQALGEAAIALALQALQGAAEQPQGSVVATETYAGVPVEVEVSALSGLISLNGAPPQLLADLLQYAGGLPPGPASALAAALVEWRDGQPEVDLTADPSARQPRRFEATEDLLLVPGMDYALYRRLAPLVSADLGGIGQVDPRSAPAGVLAVLAQGNLGQVQQYLGQRASDPTGGNTSAFNPAFTGDSGGGRLYRLQARVPLEAGKMLALTHDVVLGPDARQTAPWRVLHVERQIVQRPD